MSYKFSLLSTGLLFLALLLGLWIKTPLIGAGMPFFYHEDEAHHFNRVVNMVKEGRYDPQYFHKPSLHFYLRMPVVAGSFLWGVKRGHLRQVQEIRTTDPYGLAGYAFSVSHPGVVKWNRAFSLVLSLILVALTFYIALVLTGSNGAAFLSAALVAVSPEVVKNATIIGVDTLMATMVLATVVAAVLAMRSLSPRSVIAVGLLAGLAVSSKYNAAPVLLVPIALCVFTGTFSPGLVLAALISPVAGFLLGSPFVLVNLPLFLNHLAYEIWHYGVAGHAGHMAQPGLEQLLFYVSWLTSDGTGLVAAILACAGIFTVFKYNSKAQSLLFLLFPLAFMALMISQKTNFTRNVLPAVPFFAVLAVLAVHYAVSHFKLRRGQELLLWLAASIVLLAQPVSLSLSYVRDQIFRPESRLEAARWLVENEMIHQEVAVSGRLQMPFSLLGRHGYSQYDPSRQSLDDLLMAGFSRIVAGPENLQEDPPEVFALTKFFYGVEQRQRIISSPIVRIYDVNEELARERLEELAAQSIELDCSPPSSSVFCQPAASQEGHLWLASRAGELSLKNLPEGLQGDIVVELEIMSPWEGQSVEWRAGQSEGMLKLSQDPPGQWHNIKVEIDARTLYNEPLMLYVGKVRSPRALGFGRDERRLGVAIRAVSITDSSRAAAN